ncbi:MAG: Crp/Fnr family transcriptional regulator [Limnohabitans sp.]|nr:Crp/Fnr family transcriptional regulator [Limnohabitans sp.]
MFLKLQEKYPHLAPILKQYECFWEEDILESKTTVLEEGSISNTMYFIVEGAMRMYNNMNGKEITIQFFFENSFVSSIESYLKGTPSNFTIETIEKCKILKIKKENWSRILNENATLKNKHIDITTNRFLEYINHLMMFIQLKPEERYQQLVKDKPHILKRVPLQYIASYLGVTTVSLSRIRARKA